MVERSRIFAFAGFVVSGIGAAFLIAAFAARYWVESNKSISPSGFERMGLWEVCFHDYYPINRPITSKKYEGCWAAISYEMRDLYDHFFPPWFRAVQAMTTLALLQSVACVIINIIYFIHCCPGPNERFLVLVSAILALVAALFLFISVTMFGVHVDTDRNWLPHPDSVYLSWAFGFCILAAILCLISGMCMMTDFIRLRMESEPYNKQVETVPSHQNTHVAPPPRYDDVAIKSYDRQPDTASPRHQNHHYPASQSDSRHDGRRSYNRHSETEPSRQSARYSEPPAEYDEMRSYDRRTDTARPSHQKVRYSGSQSRDDDETKSYDRRSNTGRPSRHGGHYSESQPRYEDEAKSNDRYSDTSRRSRQGTRQSRNDDSESKSYNRHVDTTPLSRRSARHSTSQSRADESDSKLYDRRSNSARPSRQNSRQSESHSRRERTMQRY